MQPAVAPLHQRRTATLRLPESGRSWRVLVRRVRAGQNGLGQVDLAPARLGKVHQLELDRYDSEKSDDGWLSRVLLTPVIVRSPRDAPGESSHGNRNRVVRIEVGTAVHPSRAEENQREAIGRVGVRGAHLIRVPLHQQEIRSGLVQAAVERRHLAAVGGKPADRAES